jgi:hypothetical protein
LKKTEAILAATGSIATVIGTVVVFFPYFETPALTATAFGPSSLVAHKDGDFELAVSGGKPPYSYHWDFGDGTQSTNATIRHNFSTAKSYTVTGTVVDADGNRVSDGLSIVVSYLPLGVKINGPEIGLLHVGEYGAFSASISGGSNSCCIYEWYFDDGTSVFNDPSGRHRYSTVGDYEITLSVIDPEGGFAKDEFPLKVLEGEKLAIDLRVREKSSTGVVTFDLVLSPPVNKEIILQNSKYSDSSQDHWSYDRRIEVSTHGIATFKIDLRNVEHDTDWNLISYRAYHPGDITYFQATSNIITLEIP